MIRMGKFDKEQEARMAVMALYQAAKERDEL